VISVNVYGLLLKFKVSVYDYDLRLWYCLRFSFGVSLKLGLKFRLEIIFLVKIVVFTCNFFIKVVILLIFKKKKIVEMSF